MQWQVPLSILSQLEALACEPRKFCNMMHASTRAFRLRNGLGSPDLRLHPLLTRVLTACMHVCVCVCCVCCVCVCVCVCMRALTTMAEAQARGLTQKAARSRQEIRHRQAAPTGKSSRTCGQRDLQPVCMRVCSRRGAYVSVLQCISVARTTNTPTLQQAAAWACPLSQHADFFLLCLCQFHCGVGKEGGEVVAPEQPRAAGSRCLAQCSCSLAACPCRDAGHGMACVLALRIACISYACTRVLVAGAAECRCKHLDVCV